ncbi:MAG: radical SAM family heme chaperone HemW [Chloroflexi bacterium]|nr:radical SAM family heme chaperone HemW [Chloroflexota bacterium]
MIEFALYLHIPFCRKRCAYCDFNTYAGLEGLQAGYVEALRKEIVLQGSRFARDGHLPVARTIFLGGGTPSTLSVSQIDSLLTACTTSFALAENAEITLEANPSTLTSPFLMGLRDCGIKRLSLGVQSFDDGELALLGRIHNAATAQRAFSLARQAGFGNLNLDLIYGLPGQRLQTWQATLQTALSLQPEHFSLYALGVEPGTPLHHDVAAGRTPAPDPDVAADMYELAEDMLGENGYRHYEISNWSRDARLMSRHNLTYWHNEPYLGLGAGAHSWVSGIRFANVRHPSEYVRSFASAAPAEAALSPSRSPAVQLDTVEHISKEMEMAETVILGLRLVREGVSDARFKLRFGQSLWGRYGDVIPGLLDLGLLEGTAERIRLTRRGRLLGNEVFQRFLR